VIVGSRLVRAIAEAPSLEGAITDTAGFLAEAAKALR
jgi:tryptophan synthase alpha subunit